jgi:proton glutamate symport protein
VYGVPLDGARIATGAAVAVLTNFAVVGLPGQISFFIATVPISMAMGVPVELLPLLLAVEVVPDILRTVGNVTADMTVTAIVARSQGAIAADARPAEVTTHQPNIPSAEARSRTDETNSDFASE